MVYAISRPPSLPQPPSCWTRLNWYHSVHEPLVPAAMYVTAQEPPAPLAAQLPSVYRQTQRNLPQKRYPKNALRETSETTAQSLRVQGRGFVLPHLPITSVAQFAQLD